MKESPLTDYLKTADVWAVLDLIVAEFTSDPTSVQCFDLRLVARATELIKEHGRASTGMTADDRAALLAIQNGQHDDGKRLRLLIAYWHDADRADRTPRSIAYLHLGLLSGMCERLLGNAAPELLAALKRLTEASVYVDNGYCSCCHGYWPDEHQDDCEGAQALAAIAKAEESTVSRPGARH